MVIPRSSKVENLNGKESLESSLSMKHEKETIQDFPVVSLLISFVPKSR